MADPESRYPCSSIEDDFNYGSCVASASVHIRMGTFPLPVPAGRPAPSLLRCRPLGVTFGFLRQLLPGPGSQTERGSPGVQRKALLPAPRPRAPGSAEECPPPGVGRKSSLGSAEAARESAALGRRGGPIAVRSVREPELELLPLSSCLLRVERDMETSAALICHLCIKRNQGLLFKLKRSLLCDYCDVHLNAVICLHVFGLGGVVAFQVSVYLSVPFAGL